MHVTQKEIADRLGVSRPLVTQALNGVGTISEQKRREILEVAEQMGYRHNELARAVMTGRSRTIGIMTSVNMTEGMGRTVGGASEEAAEHGYSTKLMFLPGNAEEAESQKVLKRCSTWRLDGVLVVGLSDSHLEMLKEEMAYGNRPISFVSSMPPEGASGAYSDDISGWRLAIEHLYNLGHRKFSHHAADPESRLARSRHNACISVLREYGIELDSENIAFSSWYEADKIEAGTKRLLSVPQPPTALLCSSDNIAAVTLSYAIGHRISVPDQLSVMGFGGQRFTEYLHPPLTTVSQPHELVARHAVRQLIRQIDEKADVDQSQPSNPAVKIADGYKLIVRNSTAPCP